MALSVGTRIGPYEILQFTGAGGMGEVYRARDTRLNRDVAVKILPDASLHDKDPLARFRREAQVLAALNHPNIATIHGLEETDGVRALVMEFVEGRTLADVIARSRTGQSGRPPDRLSLQEALSIARQIADALEAAHEHGIVHRDLKPANVMVRHDGTVKVLDFGLAKARESVDSERELGAGAAADNSPTITSPAVTHQGIILGTAAYMSPEQARGKPVDKRTDIWAFGVVLYEMVTGRRLFNGEHVTDVLAAVVKDTPDLTAAPPAVRRLLEKCLEKDPRKRLRDISGVALLLDQADAAPAIAREVSRPRRLKTVAAYAVVGVLAAAGAVALTVVLAPKAAPVPQAIEFALEAPAGTSLTNIHSGSAVSPDGQYVVLSAAAASGLPSSLWLRRMGAYDAQLLPGTQGATSPVWSPDGKSIAFMAERKLKRLDIDSNAPVVTLADVPRADPNQPGAWNKDGVILFGCPCGLDRVSAAGGAVTSIRKVDPALKETAYGAPQFLPGGNRFIYFASSADPKVQGVYASSLSNPDERRLILNTAAKAVYVSPRAGRPGYLLWMENQTLQARPIDSDSLQWQGDPISLAEGVATSGVRAAFWTSDSGLLLYTRGPRAETKRPLVWVDSHGKVLEDVAPEGPYNAIAISPDGERVAMTREGIPRTPEANGDIWVWDFARRTNTRITFGPSTDENPTWSRDGKQIAFSSDRDGGFYQLYRRDASGAGEDERLTNAPRHMDPLDWSPDGRHIVYREMNRGTGWDLMLLPLYGDRTPITLLQTPESDSDARFSPDGRWLAYHSRLNGTSLEVYVQAFSGEGKVGLTGSRLQVSNEGGGAPLWRRDGRELYYNTISEKTPGAVKVLAVSLQLTPRLQADRPRELFQIEFRDDRLHPKDVTADGSKFLMVLRSREKPEPLRLMVVTDWQAKLATR